MTEYFTVKRIDNSRLSRPMAPARLQDYWRRVAVGAAMAACLLFYTWQHFECIQLRYEVQQLEAQRAEAKELNQRLQLQVTGLQGTGRVTEFATTKLGMTVRNPGEVVGSDATAEAPVSAQVRYATTQP